MPVITLWPWPGKHLTGNRATLWEKFLGFPLVPGDTSDINDLSPIILLSGDVMLYLGGCIL
jgi:hypothetical protein